MIFVVFSIYRTSAFHLLTHVCLETFPYLCPRLDHFRFILLLPFVIALCPSFNLLSRLALHFPREFNLLSLTDFFHLIYLI